MIFSNILLPKSKSGSSFLAAALQIFCASLFITHAAHAQKAPKVPNIKIAHAGSKPGEWTLDFDAAKKAAEETKLPILLLFIIDKNKAGDNLKTQILDQPEWKKFASENLHLVWVDVPNTAGKSSVPEKFVNMHKTLQKFKSRGASPNFTVLDSDAKTNLGGWSGVLPHHTTEYFCDLVKSHILMGTRVPKPEEKKSKRGENPAPPTPIKPAQKGAKSGEWTIDYEAAQKLASANEAPILVFVTGSDWNRASQAVVKNVFSKPGFESFAKQSKLSLVWVDLPENASLLPEGGLERVKTFRQAHIPPGVFPACFLLDSDGFIKLAGFDKTLPAMSLKELQDAVRPHLSKK